MTSQLPNFVAILWAANLDMQSDEIADACWLALQMRMKGSEEDAGAYSLVGDISDLQKQNSVLQTTVSQKDALKTVANVPDSFHLHMQNLHETQGVQLTGMPFKSPMASALPGKLEIARAIKLLMRTLPSRTKLVLNEDATIQRITETNKRIWAPVQEPALVRWFDVALVVDDSASMALWQQTAREFRILLEHHGAFRDVRLWRLATDQPGSVYLYTGTNKHTEETHAHRIKELLDPGGRRLIIVVTDCISPAWYSGEMATIFGTWGKVNMVVIVQMFPHRLWLQTALREAELLSIYGNQGYNVANSKLRTQIPQRKFDRDPSEEPSFPVPIVTLERRSLSTWARMITGHENSWAPGAVFSKKPEETYPNLLELEEEPLTATERVQIFHTSATPEARKLAGWMAASAMRLNLYLIRLIQKVMTQQTNQLHVAEVLLGGLLEEVYRNNDKDDDPQHVIYDFIEGVREELSNAVPITDAYQVIQKISHFVKENYGQAGGFSAILTTPFASGTGQTFPGEQVPFAHFQPASLRQFGGMYASIAGQTEQTINNFDYETIVNKVPEAPLNVSQQESSTDDIPDILSETPQIVIQPEEKMPVLLTNNVSLAHEEGQIILEVLDEPEASSYSDPKNLEQKFPQGQITLNPSSCLIFTLPPSANPEPAFLALDRSRWDLYLISIPFTLHPPYQHSTYSRFSFFVEFDTSTQAIAQDLFPKHVLTPIASDTEYTISPMGTFQKLAPDAPPSGPRFRTDSFQPKIQAFGQGLPNFYWRYEAPGNGTGIQPETKYVFVVVRVPSGTTSIHGTIHCKATLTVRPFQFITYKKNAAVTTFPFHWDITSLLQKTQTKIKEPSLQPLSLFDVCLVCALAEEAQALLAEISRQCHTTFQEGYSQTLKRDYRHTTLQNRYGETLRVLVSWQPNSRAIETGLHVSSLVREMRPRFVGMTGICAGDPTRVALGDLVIAERTFLYDSGTLVKDETGRTLYQHNTTTWQPHLETLQTIRMFTSWQSTIANLPRPISRRQQEDWLLSTLLKSPTHRLEDIPLQELQHHAPLWRTIVFALQGGPSPLLSEERQLIDPAHIQKRYYRTDEFPYLDPATPTVHISPIASENTERTDQPFAEVHYPVRGTVAVDLEGAVFYRTLADFPDIRSLLVKGVCDYADRFRDETYRTYASTISAAYMLSFLQNYVRGEHVE